MKKFPGDQGETSLCQGKKISKTAFIFEVLGDLDELMSLLGLTSCYFKDKKFKKWLEEIEEDLFKIGEELAGGKSAEKIKLLEKLDEKLAFCQKNLPPLKNFILPGTSLESSFLDFTRAVTRRLERKVWQLKKRKKIDPLIGAYFNHLSKFLFFFARLLNQKKKLKEKIFKSKPS